MPYHQVDCLAGDCLFCAERALNIAINQYSGLTKLQAAYDEAGETLRVSYAGGATFEAQRGPVLPAQIRLLVADINTAAAPLLAAAAAAADAAQPEEVVVP